MARKKITPDPLVRSQNKATWLASGVAVLALIVSVFSLYETRMARVAATRDEISFSLHRPSGDATISITKKPGSNEVGAIVAPWSMLLSNVGSSTVSVTSYEVTQIAGANDWISYADIDSGMTTTEGNEAVSFPLTLEAGRSIRMNLNIGLNPGLRAYGVLSGTVVGQTSSMGIWKAELLLAAKSIDIFDNPVKPFYSDGAVSGYLIESRLKEQVFLVKVTTSRGVVTSELAYWYGHPDQR